ncbi:carbohydrate binding domain-containing protein [Longimicrobium sp.]|jgi:hypothetical protein|uniref:carbohydrate binding domain-containing protein n=1 Tax=Longimicrobium sp. TaxID=2029185 RepID=UPI002ED9E655
MRRRILLPLALGAALLSACTDDAGPLEPGSAPIAPGTGPRFSGSVATDPQARLYANGDYWLGWAPRRAFTTLNPLNNDSVYLRIADSKWPLYNAFYDGAVDDSLQAWAQDSRLNLNPNFVAAILAIESGFDPHVYEGGVGTYGYAQMGPDSDDELLQQIRYHSAFTWMHSQVDSTVYVRGNMGNKDSVSLSGSYLADPMKTTRALVYHLKQLENIWLGTHKVNGSTRSWLRDDRHIALKAEFSGYLSYAELAAHVYGRPPNATELFDIIAASFNRGYPWVDSMMVMHGSGWVEHVRNSTVGGACLTPAGQRDDAARVREAGCYLDRARHYTILFQNAATSVSTGHEVVDDFDSGALDRWFTYQGPGSTVTRTVPPGSEAHRGTAVDEGSGLRVDYSVASGSWGGVGRWYSAPQNWKTRTGIGNTEGIGFWYYGNGRDLNAGAGVVVSVELQDNRSADPALQGVDTAERWVFSFRDNFIGWRYIDVPWTAFSRGSWQPHASTPNDGLTLTQVWGIVFAPQTSAKWFRLDQFRLVQDRPWT